jgi:hypothetical protein
VADIVKKGSKPRDGAKTRKAIRAKSSVSSAKDDVEREACRVHRT